MKRNLSHHHARSILALLCVGIAALFRAGALRVLVDKKPFTNPVDPELQEHLRVSRHFDKVELVLEEMDVDPDLLTEVRALVIKLTGRKKLDETPAAISAEMETFANDLLAKADKVTLWAEPAELPLSAEFVEGREVFSKILALTNPVHRVNEIATNKEKLEGHAQVIRGLEGFVEKSGKAFTELRNAAALIEGLEFRLSPEGECASFLDQWRNATAKATASSPEVWKALINARALADHELQKVGKPKRAARRRTRSPHCPAILLRRDSRRWSCKRHYLHQSKPFSPGSKRRRIRSASRSCLIALHGS